MILWALFWLSLFSGSSLAYSKSLSNQNASLVSVYARLSQLGSKTLLNGLESDDYQVIEDALTRPNITLFLPNDSAIQSAVATGTLNFTQVNATIPQILRHTLSTPYNSNFLLRGRQYFYSDDSTHLPLVIGSSQQDNSNSTLLQVSSGITTADVIVKDIQCSNGIIHLIDHFLQPPMATLSTIETLPELETHELLMKSLNLTTVVSGPNKTVLAPINEAWAEANSSTMPYGTLVHNLKFQVLEGIYLSTSLFSSVPDTTVTLNTMRRDSSLTFERSANNELLVIGKNREDIARVVRADVITTEGVVHLVDKVLSADFDGASKVNSQTGGNDQSGSRGGGGSTLAAAPVDDPSNIPPADILDSYGSIGTSIHHRSPNLIAFITSCIIYVVLSGLAPL
ncbi:hypothetical protein BDB00DRAFT_795029 [Zychaea mexicana]|uniref:uncharacterized protein n=1 Tax=Zychaea mexicana TaxID=64656 RepID=UPI0022FEA776|nr:uncharacterized protein BDB00DRAFT_795029 [Zychaea mexicana]KAI9499663.1 hypothetical protein BDB00DRAFT_795029 [Zychaea mexicana]